MFEAVEIVMEGDWSVGVVGSAGVPDGVEVAEGSMPPGLGGVWRSAETFYFICSYFHVLYIS